MPFFGTVLYIGLIFWKSRKVQYLPNDLTLPTMTDTFHPTIRWDNKTNTQEYTDDVIKIIQIRSESKAAQFERQNEQQKPMDNP
uniref:Uncharacterized protein n=1 Tax=Syphacia muris TaxID=451379 RepID=A0A0N5AXL4_9BILA